MFRATGPRWCRLVVKIAGSVVAVTGGASGIGAALCRRLHAGAARAIAVIDRDAAAAERVAREVGGSAYAADVGIEVELAGALHQFALDHGDIDLHCSNAGIAHLDPDHVASAENSVWQANWSVNVMAHVYGVRALLPMMRQRQQGHFLITASAAGLLSQIGSASYSVTKHAAVAFAESLSISHQHEGIAVTLLCPQAVDTPMLRGSGEGAAQRRDGVLGADAVAACALAAVEAGRFMALPHPEVAEYARRRAHDVERWMAGMRRLVRRNGAPEAGSGS